MDVNAVCEVGAFNSAPMPPLHAAAAGNTSGKIRGQKEVAELLIAKGADVNVKANGDTPLDLAVWSNHKDIADLLRKHGGKTGLELRTADK